MRTDRLQQTLLDLNGTSADIEASALISTDGLMMASALPQGMDEDRIGAMTAALLSLGERAAMELARGKLRRIGEQRCRVSICAHAQHHNVRRLIRSQCGL